MEYSVKWVKCESNGILLNVNLMEYPVKWVKCESNGIFC
jgi:hypothetical protein